MATVREATFELFRAHGMTTIFGNPGSTELPMLADFPDDFTYVLGLQEAVVVGMADGYAQASGQGRRTSTSTPRRASATRSAAIFNAQANKSPLVITAGQQVRAQITMEANLTNRDAAIGAPAVRQVEPRAAARRRTCPPRSPARSTTPRCRRAGPAFVSIPMDDWGVEADAPIVRRRRSRRRVGGRAGADPDALARSPSASAKPRNPVLVAGPGDRRERRLGRGRRAGRAPAPAGVAPARARAAGGSASPRATRNSWASCRRRSGRSAETLKGHDLVLVVGSSVFPYYPYIPGPLLPEGTSLVAITSDPDEAARAPMGDAIVGDVALALRRAGRARGRGRPRSAASRVPGAGPAARSPTR